MEAIVGWAAEVESLPQELGENAKGFICKEDAAKKNKSEKLKSRCRFFNRDHILQLRRQERGMTSAAVNVVQYPPHTEICPILHPFKDVKPIFRS